MLPIPLTSFVGRTRELQELTALLERARLVTLLGAGGSGKTRLALAVASRLESAYEHVWFVELAPLAAGALLAQTVANVVGVRETPNLSLADALIQHFQPLHALLVLDNCEQVIEASAQLAYALLLACPHLTIVATSREAFKVDGEQTYLVPLLSIPRSHESVSWNELERYEAIRLYVERARAVDSRFELNADNAGAILRICRRLDGIPLAIELAAARAKILSPAQIAAHLDDQFLLLQADSRTILPRHQTLHAAMDWSYDLLEDEERELLNALAVFVGGFELDAVQAVHAQPATLDLLTRLAEKSLIVVEQRANKPARYHLLEIVRQYALQKLRASGAEETVRDAHAQFFAARIQAADAAFYGPRQIALLEWMDDEHGNARATLEWLLHKSTQGDTAALRSGLLTAAGMWWFWDLRGYVREGRSRFEPFITLAETLPPGAERAYAYIMFGRLTLLQGDREMAIAYPERALEMGEQLGDERTIMLALQGIAIQRARMIDPAKALPTIEKALALGRRFQHRHVMYTMLLDLAEITHNQGDEERTRAAYQEALELIRAQGDRWNIGAVHYSMGVHAWNHQEDVAARKSFRACLLAQQEMNDSRGMAYSLDSLAWVAARGGDPKLAARLFGASHALFKRMGARLFPRRQPLHDHAEALARAALGDASYELEFAQGQTLALSNAVQEALAVGTDRTPALAPSTALPDPLSERELQVLHLLATDLSNREIADQLIVSLNTVKTQIKSIYSKLDTHTRAGAVTQARALGLL